MGPLVPPASQRHRFYTGSAEAQRPAGEGLSMGDKCSAEHGILRDSVEGVYGCCVDRRLVWVLGLGLFVSVVLGSFRVTALVCC